MAKTEAAPAASAAPRLRHPRSARTRSASRFIETLANMGSLRRQRAGLPCGAAPQRPSAHPSTLGRCRCALGGGCEARRMDAQLLDASRIGIEDFEFEAGWMPDELTARRHPAQQSEHEATQGIDVLRLFGLEELQTEVVFELAYGRARRRDEAQL